MIYLQIVEANHVDDQFYTLGGAGFETAAERAENLMQIPAFEHDCDADDRCYILDFLDEEMSITDDREISAQTAMELLGVDDLGPLRESEKQMVNLVIADTKPTEPE